MEYPSLTYYLIYTSRMKKYVFILKIIIVLDPFMGSGTTAFVAKKLKRNWIGIEKENKNIKLIKSRIRKI